MNAIEISGLGHSYGSRRALDSLSLTVGRGEIFGVLGPNGGGKTTLFQILSTAISPARGSSVSVMGADLASDPVSVRKNIGVIFQAPSLDKKLTVRENLMHQGHLYGLRGAGLKEKISVALARFGLSDRAGDLVETLSGGLSRRAEIAKGLLHSPALLLLDEPSTGIDPGARRDVWRVLHDLRRKQNVTVLLTTHIMEEAEACDRVAILHKGKIVAAGTPASLKETISGRIVSLETDDPAALSGKIQAKFNVKTSLLDGTVRVEHGEGGKLLSSFMDAFPGEIKSATIRTPTLEDVFVHYTGHRFWEEHAVT